MSMVWKIRDLRKVLIGLAATSLLFVSSIGASAGDLEVASIRLGVHESYTRFVLDMSDKVSPRVFTLADPYRVVIDLPAAEWSVPQATNGDVTGLVQGYRYGLFRPGNSRLVIDMTGPGKVARLFTLDPAAGKGHRLVVDLAPVSRETFLAEAGWPTDNREPSLASSPLRNPAKEPKRSKYVVAIDAGHGGIDPGAIGRTGIHEKNVSLAVAKRLKKSLQATGKYDVVMVRDGDVFHSLRERVDIARRSKADLFISLHADTIRDRSVRGAAVYTLSETASDSEAAELASKENRSDIIAGVDTSEIPSEISMILIELSQRETKNRSSHFAELLMPELKKETRLLRNTHRFAGFRVLKAPDVPSVLIELGYMSNSEDERNLMNPDWQRRVAGAIAKGVDAYFESAENGQMRQAWVQ